MKYILTLIVLIGLGIGTLKAQEATAETDLNVQTFSREIHRTANIMLPSEMPYLLRLQKLSDASDLVDPMISARDSWRQDSGPSTVKGKLLPDNMSLMEHGLWGESGILRTIGLAGPLTPETRKSELGLRRTMLSLHQIGGFVTLGLMGTAAYYGQKVIDGQDFWGAHQSFVAATIVSYSITAMLSILSPPPLIRRDETSTTTIHKTLAWIHFAGMIVTPILGKLIGGRRSFDDQRARIHQTAAYITTATLAASLIIITF